VILAATSNNWSVRRLGSKRWKWLHRLAYVAAAVLIYHQSIAGKGHWYISRWLLLWLVVLQAVRITKYWAKSSARTRDFNLRKNEAVKDNRIV
jgi:sulfoxide reductase heme-binding subunit YedZ